MKKSKQTFSEQLAGLSDQLPVKRNKTYVPSLNNIGVDGVDHINIYQHGETTLGQALDRLADLPFKHNLYGKFKSIEGFWHYMRSHNRDDTFRVLSGYKARQAGGNIQEQFVENFKFIIADANWQKINAYPALKEEIKTLTLAFDAYYIHNAAQKVWIRPTNSIWLVPCFHEIRMALQENREPDFQFLLDKYFDEGRPRSKDTRDKNQHLRNVYKTKEKKVNNKTHID
jgi:hypothetical protein